MPAPQFSLKAMLWFTLAAAMVLTQWAMIAETGEAGELPALAWMAATCLAAFIALIAIIAFRP